MRFSSLNCCGILEIVNLSAWPESKDNFFHALTNNGGILGAAWVCFNGRNSQGYVAEFADWLQKENLIGTGQIITLPRLTNPNSSNVLDVRMWALDRDRIREWWLERCVAGPCECVACRTNAVEQTRLESYRLSYLKRKGLVTTKFAPSAPGTATSPSLNVTQVVVPPLDHRYNTNPPVAVTLNVVDSNSL